MHCFRFFVSRCLFLPHQIDKKKCPIKKKKKSKKGLVGSIVGAEVEAETATGTKRVAVADIKAAVEVETDIPVVGIPIIARVATRNATAKVAVVVVVEKEEAEVMTEPEVEAEAKAAAEPKVATDQQSEVPQDEPEAMINPQQVESDLVHQFLLVRHLQQESEGGRTRDPVLVPHFPVVLFQDRLLLQLGMLLCHLLWEQRFLLVLNRPLLQDPHQLTF